MNSQKIKDDILLCNPTALLNTEYMKLYEQIYRMEREFLEKDLELGIIENLYKSIIPNFHRMAYPIGMMYHGMDSSIEMDSKLVIERDNTIFCI